MCVSDFFVRTFQLHKDGMEVFGLIGCDELEELTDAQREFVQSDEAMQFKSN